MSLLWKTATSQAEDRWIPGEGWASHQDPGPDFDFDRDYKPPPWHHIKTPDRPCMCEHIEHEDPNEAQHPPFRGPAEGHHKALYVGDVCDECAHGHLSEYVRQSRGCPQCPDHAAPGWE
jgi:hypothetical protein